MTNGAGGPAQVAPEFQGLWRRLYIEWGDGRGDVATTVFWLQTESFYCDIRLPFPRPAARAGGFAGLTVADALGLAAQEAFAGVLAVEGDVCTWARQIDFAPTGTIDRGRAARTGRMLVETGTDAAYVEHWWQDLEGPLPPLQARHDPLTGAIAVRAGATVMTAIDRRSTRPEPGTLAERAAEAAERGDAGALADLLDCEVAFGRLGPDHRSWTVELCTLPWAIGEQRDLPFDIAAGGAA